MDESGGSVLAADLFNVGYFLDVPDDLIQVLYAVDIEHDLGLYHAHIRIQMKRFDVDEGFRDHLDHIIDKSLPVDPLDEDAREEPDGFLVVPFGLNDAVSVF